MKKISLLFFLLPALFAGSSLSAQLTDLPTLHDTLYAKAIGEKRPLEIVLPQDYDKHPDEKYEVLYVTDGEYTTKIVSSFAQFLGIQFLPPLIVVSVPNTVRERDMLPTHTDNQPNSGGAANFLSFFKNDLIPYINTKYRSSGVNTLYGSSFAGVFTMYAFLKEPQLFQSYMLADPALWWDNGYMIKLAKETLATLPITHTSLLMAGREGAAMQYMGVSPMDSVIRAKAPAGLRYKLNVYSDETHNSMIFRTVYDGLKFTYAGYSNEQLKFYPSNGIVLKGQPLKIHCDGELLKELHYTTDGSDPSPSSAKIDSGIISLNGPAKLTVKAFCNHQRFNKSVTGQFKEGAALPSSAKPKNAAPGGFSYAYYEGEWDSLPDFNKLKPLRSGQADTSFDPKKLPRQQNFALLRQGWLEIKQDGYYLFAFDCDGGARLSLGRQVLIDYNGLHKSGDFQTFMLPLVKGFYPFRLEYFRKKGDGDLRLYYAQPGQENPDSIAPELEYSTVKK